jgi:hypothetical protein
VHDISQTPMMIGVTRSKDNVKYIFIQYLHYMLLKYSNTGPTFNRLTCFAGIVLYETNTFSFNGHLVRCQFQGQMLFYILYFAFNENGYCGAQSDLISVLAHKRKCRFFSTTIYNLEIAAGYNNIY